MRDTNGNSNVHADNLEEGWNIALDKVMKRASYLPARDSAKHGTAEDWGYSCRQFSKARIKSIPGSSPSAEVDDASDGLGCEAETSGHKL
ncbi:hypothetical protein FRC08_002214 [Ceratobasidium sp. 394]|nr:hypothetical protein FRC08_002214 [Ceratobasidium sp. 394]